MHFHPLSSTPMALPRSHHLPAHGQRRSEPRRTGSGRRRDGQAAATKAEGGCGLHAGGQESRLPRPPGAEVAARSRKPRTVAARTPSGRRRACLGLQARRLCSSAASDVHAFACRMGREHRSWRRHQIETTNKRGEGEQGRPPAGWPARAPALETGQPRTVAQQSQGRKGRRSWDLGSLLYVTEGTLDIRRKN